MRCAHDWRPEAFSIRRTNSGCVPIVEPQAGSTALHKACAEGHFPCVKILIEKGADVDAVNHVRSHGPADATPSHNPEHDICDHRPPL